MELLLASLNVTLALTLMGAAAHKAIAIDRLASGAARLAGVSQRLGGMLSFAAAAWEAGAAIMLLNAPTRVWGELLAAALWSTYAILAWRAKRAGEAFDCGCNFSRGQQGTDSLTVPRAALLALVAVGAALFPGDARIELLSTLAGTAFFSFLIAAGELAVLTPLRRSLPQ